MRRAGGKVRRRCVRRGIKVGTEARMRTLGCPFRYLGMIGLRRLTRLMGMRVNDRLRLEPAQSPALMDVMPVVPPQVQHRQAVHRCHVQDQQQGRKPARVTRPPIVKTGLHF